MTDENEQDLEGLIEVNAEPIDEVRPAAPAAAEGGDGAALQEQRERYLRLAAEYDNFRKRSTKERLEAHARGQGELIKPLLDALDDLSRFSHLDPAATDTKTVVEGVGMVERKLLKTLAASGLEVVDPTGVRFDPNQHEAITTAPAASAEEDDTVATTFQVGYVFNGQLLRPARVVVKQWNG